MSPESIDKISAIDPASMTDNKPSTRGTLKDISIYTDRKVSPESINNSAARNEILTIEVPTDSPLAKGDRVISQVTQEKGIVSAIGSSYVSVLFDGAKERVCLCADTIARLVKVEVRRKDLLKAIDRLKESLNNSKVIDSIKKIPQRLFQAARQFLLEKEGRGIVERLRQLVSGEDYELYMTYWS